MVESFEDLRWIRKRSLAYEHGAHRHLQCCSSKQTRIISTITLHGAKVYESHHRSHFFRRRNLGSSCPSDGEKETIHVPTKPRSSQASCQSQSREAKELTVDQSSRKHAIRYQRSNPRWSSGDRLHFRGCTRNSRVTDPEASDLEGYCWMPRRQQHASSSFGRKESHNPIVRTSGDGLQSKESDDSTNLLPPGVKLLPHLVTRIEETLKKTFGNLNLTNSLSKLQYGVFSKRECTWACIIPIEQISRDLHQRLSKHNLSRIRRTC